MPNVFDHYDHPENRLSHALAVCLHADRALLRGFPRMDRGTPPVAPRQLDHHRQSLSSESSETEERRRNGKGLPDIVI